MTVHSNSLQNKAKILRSKGKTYSEIHRLLGKHIPKSTLSYWCKKIQLPEWYQLKIDRLNVANLTRAQKIAWISNKKKQKDRLENFYAKNKHLIDKLNDKNIVKMLLSILYLGEGAKWKSNRSLTLGSSDPNIIQMYINSLKICYGIHADRFKCRVSYRADQNIKSLEKYWSHVSGIPLKNFYKTIPDSRTIGKPTLNKEYKGVCVVSGGGTEIQLELETIAKMITKGV